MAELRKRLNKNKDRIDTLRESKPESGLLGQSSSSLVKTQETAPAVEPEPKPAPASVPEPEPETDSEDTEEIVSPEEAADQTMKTFNRFETESERFNKELDKLDKNDANWLRQHFAELNKEKDRLRELYKEDRNRAEWAEIAQIVGLAAVQLAAAYEGVKTGRDMSGIKFKPSDWSNRYNRIMQDYKMTVNDLEDKSRQERAIRKEEVSTDKEQLRRQYQAAIKDITYSNAQQRKESAEKIKREKDANKKAQAADKERAKIEEKFRKAFNAVDDMDEDIINEDKAYAKIREALKLGPEKAKELKEADRGGRSIWEFWLKDNPDKLKDTLKRMKEKQLNMIDSISGAKPAEARPVTPKEGEKVSNIDELPEI